MQRYAELGEPAIHAKVGKTSCAAPAKRKPYLSFHCPLLQ